MSTQITLNVYSGLPNPTWSLTDQQEMDLQVQLEKFDVPTAEKSPGASGLLGYRGFTLSRNVNSPYGPLSSHLHAGILDLGPGELNLAAPNRALEEWLLATAP